jgi:hypothetical protein
MKYEQEIREKDKRIRVLEEKTSLYEKGMFFSIFLLYSIFHIHLIFI